MERIIFLLITTIAFTQDLKLNLNLGLLNQETVASFNTQIFLGSSYSLMVGVSNDSYDVIETPISLRRHFGSESAYDFGFGINLSRAEKSLYFFNVGYGNYQSKTFMYRFGLDLPINRDRQNQQSDLNVSGVYIFSLNVGYNF